MSAFAFTVFFFKSLIPGSLSSTSSCFLPTMPIACIPSLNSAPLRTALSHSYSPSCLLYRTTNFQFCFLYRLQIFPKKGTHRFQVHLLTARDFQASVFCFQGSNKHSYLAQFSQLSGPITC
uniref:Secreted protein n=1 Tax=Cacopsylla melanoneura TaxID=428564 RepID=A0A8D9BFS5_9HEMI